MTRQASGFCSAYPGEVYQGARHSGGSNAVPGALPVYLQFIAGTCRTGGGLPRRLRSDETLELPPMRDGSERPFRMASVRHPS